MHLCSQELWLIVVAYSSVRTVLEYVLHRKRWLSR